MADRQEGLSQWTVGWMGLKGRAVFSLASASSASPPRSSLLRAPRKAYQWRSEGWRDLNATDLCGLFGAPPLQHSGPVEPERQSYHLLATSSVVLSKWAWQMLLLLVVVRLLQLMKLVYLQQSYWKEVRSLMGSHEVCAV